jgi:hypothetical protein
MNISPPEATATTNATQRQDRPCDPAHRPSGRGKPKKPQIDDKYRADHQADGQHMNGFNDGKQQIVLADIVGEAARFEITDEIGERTHQVCV